MLINKVPSYLVAKNKSSMKIKNHGFQQLDVLLAPPGMGTGELFPKEQIGLFNLCVLHQV